MIDDEGARAARIVARVRAAEGPDGRLPLPDMAGWDIFPYEGELLVKRLDEPVLPEPPRQGEGGVDCRTCGRGVERAIWHDEHWQLVALEPAAMPIVLLEPRAHHDLGDLPEELSYALGPTVQRVRAAVLSLGGIARVHVMVVGDGAEHLHVWFIARPTGLLQLRGSSLVDWLDILPPMPQDEWDTALTAITAALS